MGEAYNTEEKQDIVAITYGIASDGGHNLQDLSVKINFVYLFIFFLVHAFLKEFSFHAINSKNIILLHLIIIFSKRVTRNLKWSRNYLIFFHLPNQAHWNQLTNYQVLVLIMMAHYI